MALKADGGKQYHDPVRVLKIPLENAGKALKGSLFDNDVIARLEVFTHSDETVLNPRLNETDDLVVDARGLAITANNTVDPSRKTNLVQHFSGAKAGEDVTSEKRLNAIDHAGDGPTEIWPAQARNKRLHTPRPQILARPVLLLRLSVDRVPRREIKQFFHPHNTPPRLRRLVNTRRHYTSRGTHGAPKILRRTSFK